MTLIFSTATNQSQEILDRIKRLCLACHIKHDGQEGQIILIEGENKVVGFQAIQAHLQEIESELYLWDNCGCET